MRSKAAGEGGEMTVRTAQPTRDIEHLSRLLAEHLAKIQLLAPVGDLELLATEVHSLEEKSRSAASRTAAGGRESGPGARTHRRTAGTASACCARW